MNGQLITAGTATIKKLTGLKQRKHRDESGLFLMEGLRAVEETVAADWPVEFCLVTVDFLNHPRAEALVAKFLAKRTRVMTTTNDVLCKLADTEQPQGIIAAVRRRQWLWPDCIAGKNPMVLVLDQVQDPGNVGTIIRTADAAGCSGVFLTKGCADIFMGKTLRSTMGSVFHLPIVQDCDPGQLAGFLIEYGLDLIIAALDADKLHYQSDLTSPIAVVLGNEANGVGEALRRQATQKIRIPIHGEAESLNVAAAAAILAFEAVRQRECIL